MKYSRLLLGTVQFGLNYGIANTEGKPSFDRVKSILTTALEHGIDSLDTAASYGDSEEVLGKAMAELGIASKMNVVSKVPQVPAGCDALEFITNSVKNSLKRLRLPELPLVLFHNELDWRYRDELESLIQKGMIRAAGVSLDSAACADTAESAPYIQLPCNVFDHRFDEKIKNHINSVLLGYFDELCSFSKTVKEEIANVRAARPALLTDIPAPLLSAYEALRNGKDRSIPLVTADNEVCGHCRLKITPQTATAIKRGEIAYCDNCQHLLYDPESLM